MVWLLQRTDDPIAVTYVNAVLAERRAKADGRGYDSVQMQINDAWTPGRLRGKQLSVRSVIRMRIMTWPTYCATSLSKRRNRCYGNTVTT